MKYLFVSLFVVNVPLENFQLIWLIEIVFYAVSAIFQPYN